MYVCLSVRARGPGCPVACLPGRASAPVAAALTTAPSTQALKDACIAPALAHEPKRFGRRRGPLHVRNGRGRAGVESGGECVWKATRARRVRPCQQRAARPGAPRVITYRCLSSANMAGPQTRRRRRRLPRSPPCRPRSRCACSLYALFIAGFVLLPLSPLLILLPLRFSALSDLSLRPKLRLPA